MIRQGWSKGRTFQRYLVYFERDNFVENGFSDQFFHWPTVQSTAIESLDMPRNHTLLMVTFGFTFLTFLVFGEFLPLISLFVVGFKLILIQILKSKLRPLKSFHQFGNPP